MTPFSSTPVIWIAIENSAEATNIAQRIGDFCEPRVLNFQEFNRSEFLHFNGHHHSAWLLVGSDMAENDGIIEAATEAKEAHEFFRCIVVGADQKQRWPEGTIHLDRNILSTTIIDRLRNESHVLRITSSRMRHLRRLQNR